MLIKRLLNGKVILVLAIILISANTASGWIIEPDNIIFGNLYVNSSLVTGYQTLYTITLEVDSIVIASYTMGDLPGNYYVLNIPMVSPNPYKTEPKPTGFAITGEVGTIKLNGEEIDPPIYITLGQRGSIFNQDINLEIPFCYLDADNDNYGDVFKSIQADTCPQGYVKDNSDCDDTDPKINPGIMEICNGVDDDCDGEEDEENSLRCSIYYKDNDQDGYGLDGDTLCLCNPDIMNKYTAFYAGDPDDEDPQLPDVNVTFDISLAEGWSMISLPVVPNNSTVSDLFPDAVVIYGYERGSGYVRIKMEEILEVGRGYWLLLDQNQTYNLDGKIIPAYTHKVTENGWEMIGGCSSAAKASVDTCNIGVIYGYIQEGGYRRVLESEHLEPGKGYWILLNNIMSYSNLKVENIGF